MESTHETRFVIRSTTPYIVTYSVYVKGLECFESQITISLCSFSVIIIIDPTPTTIPFVFHVFLKYRPLTGCRFSVHPGGILLLQIRL